jgi:polysaccharide deacetylase 2 family uncharacterized protein YibQ
VASDDLNAPLGQDKKKKWPVLPIGVPQILAGLLGLSGLSIVAWALFAHDPLGGEPVAVVATPALSTPAYAKGQAAGSGSQNAHYDGPSAAPNAGAAHAVAKVPANSRTVTIIDGSSGKRQQIVIPDPPAVADKPANKSEAYPLDKRLLEMTPQGALPVIGANGTRPLTFYAHPRTLPANRRDAPRIAVVVGGLGISASDTAEALAKLPAPVTLAFAPYGRGLGKLVAQARAQGHEVLLQIPMEPFDYPNNDPGPSTLLTSLTTKQNIDRLHWLMARFQGYVGLINYMGAKFTASEQALTPVIRETGKRGLIYVDDGASARSVAGQIAGGSGVPFVKADIVLDAVPTPVEIKRGLKRLELAARDRGAAVGFASAQPAAITTIANWAKQVEGRGYVLVPITMVAVKTKSS